LNGKVLIKLDLTKKESGAYELGVRVQPTNSVMWMSFQFKMHGSELSEFSISGDPRDIQGNRLVHTLNIPSQKELKFTFKPEILMSVADIVVGTPMEGTQFGQESTNSNAQQNSSSSTGPSTSPFLNPQLFGAIPEFIKNTMNQRANECNQYANFIRTCPTELNQLQQHLTSIITNSEIIRETPRMVNSLIRELHSNPDYALINQRIQEFLAGTRQQYDGLRTQMQQNQQPTDQSTAPQQNSEVPPTQQPTETPNTQKNTEQSTAPQQPTETPNTQQNTEQSTAPQQNVEQSQPTIVSQPQPTQQPFPNFPPSMENVQQLFQQLPSEQQSTPIVEAIQTVLAPINNLYEQAHRDFTAHQQQYQDLITFPTNQTEQPITQTEVVPSAPVIEHPVESVETVSQEPQIMGSSDNVEKTKAVEQDRAHSSTSSRQNDSAWTYIFATKGITGYVRHVKGLTNRVPYHRNFCSAQDWVLPDGKTIKVELVHALHPDAPFICLFDYDNTIDMFFVQTLLDGSGEEIHKIDSFSNSYQGFSSDMLLKSAEIDDCVRIKIEAIVDLD